MSGVLFVWFTMFFSSSICLCISSTSHFLSHMLWLTEVNLRQSESEVESGFTLLQPMRVQHPDAIWGPLYEVFSSITNLWLPWHQNTLALYCPCFILLLLLLLLLMQNAFVIPHSTQRFSLLFSQVKVTY